MTVVNKAAPALARLLEDSALSRAVFSACRLPLALVDATTARRILWVNPAFEGFFGWKQADSTGRGLATLIFRGDDGLVQRLVADAGSHWNLDAYGKDGATRHVEVALGAVRAVDGRLTHWVLSFCDRTEVEQLRAELHSALQPAGGAQEPRVEVAPPHELHT
jgi:PAS domain S-box-containing protein